MRRSENKLKVNYLCPVPVKAKNEKDKDTLDR
jgi:hypothetical protein